MRLAVKFLVFPLQSLKCNHIMRKINVLCQRCSLALVHVKCLPKLKMCCHVKQKVQAQFNGYKYAYLPGFPNFPGDSRIFMFLYDCTTETKISRKRTHLWPNLFSSLDTMRRRYTWPSNQTPIGIVISESFKKRSLPCADGEPVRPIASLLFIEMQRRRRFYLRTWTAVLDSTQRFGWR